MTEANGTTSSTNPDQRRRRPSLGAIFLTIFIDLLGFGLVLPFLAEEARDTFQTTALTGTLLGSIYSLMQFLFVPVWGRLSDRIGRRPVLIWSVAATGVSMLGLGIALAYGQSVAWLADITKPEERARGMGLIGMAFGLGFILGPGIGGVLAAIPVNGRHGPIACYAAAGLSLVNVIWVFLGLAESLPPEKRNTTSTRKLTLLDWNAAKTTFSEPGIAYAILVNFIILLAFTNLDQTFRYFTKDIFEMTAWQTGMALAFVGVVAAGVQGGLIRPLVKRFGEVMLIRAGTACQMGAFALLAMSPALGVVSLFAASGILAFGNGLTQPSTSAYISKRASSAAQGETLGTSQAIGSLARMFGPALGGLLYGFGPSAPYVFASFGMVVALLFAQRLKDTPAIQNTSTQIS
jgi:MFS transporter, DHA1 family, tetracycline resistance protein